MAHISLPLGQSVEAEGKTKAELEKAIHDVYVPELYRRLSVNVKLEDRYYWVKGEVRNPNQLFSRKDPKGSTITVVSGGAGERQVRREEVSRCHQLALGWGNPARRRRTRSAGV